MDHSISKGIILGIESSCDDTAASIVKNGRVLSNIVLTQTNHAEFGGIVPELASRAHQQHIVPVVERSLFEAGVTKDLTGRVKAGYLMREFAQRLGGKGGGRPDMAQGGGTDVAALPEVLKAVPEWVKSQLS